MYAIPSDTVVLTARWAYGAGFYDVYIDMSKLPDIAPEDAYWALCHNDSLLRPRWISGKATGAVQLDSRNRLSLGVFYLHSLGAEQATADITRVLDYVPRTERQTFSGEVAYEQLIAFLRRRDRMRVNNTAELVLRVGKGLSFSRPVELTIVTKTHPSNRSSR